MKKGTKKRAVKRYEETPALIKAVEACCRAYGLGWLHVSGKTGHPLGPRSWPAELVLETLFAPSLEIRRPPRLPFNEGREWDLRNSTFVDTQDSTEFTQAETDIAFAAARLTHLMKDLIAYDFQKLREPPLDRIYGRLAKSLSEVLELLSDETLIADWNAIFGQDDLKRYREVTANKARWCRSFISWDEKTKASRRISRNDGAGSAAERFIRERLGPCYFDIYGVEPGRTGSGSEPSGPYVRFVRAFFQLIGHQIAPKSIARLMAPSAQLRKSKSSKTRNAA
ncbi:MAG: hypothetical protein ACAH22_02395 [Tardiphaga sp.]